MRRVIGIPKYCRIHERRHREGNGHMGRLRRSILEKIAVRPRAHEDEGGLFQPMDQEEISACVACLAQSSLDRIDCPIKCIEN